MMAIARSTVIPGLLEMLRISGVDGTFSFLTWTISTGAITSSYLPTDTITLLKHRVSTIMSAVDSADRARQRNLIADLLSFKDPSGSVSVLVDVDSSGDVVTVSLGQFSSTTNYYVFVSIPHSIGSPLL